VIVAATSEMLMSDNAEALIRAVLTESTALSLDAYLFDDNAALPEERPAGLLHGIDPLPAGATMLDDLEALAAAVAPIAGDQIVFVASPKEAVAIKLRLPREFPWPVLPSAALPEGRLIAIAANALVSASETVPSIEASRQATIHYEDDNPAEIVGPPSTVDDAIVGGVVARPVASIFQSDAVALRLRWPLSWALRSPQGLAWMEEVTWP
jgi:hypothetical protein